MPRFGIHSMIGAVIHKCFWHQLLNPMIQFVSQLTLPSAENGCFQEQALPPNDVSGLMPATNVKNDVTGT
jgi:hypothetical protein